MLRNKRLELLEAYLAEVAAELRPLRAPEVREIVRELRSHVLERLEIKGNQESLTRVLERLGDPRAIAREHLEARSGPREMHYSTPDAISESPSALLGWVAGSARTAMVLVGSGLAYGFALCWLCTALAKPFRPANVGLWLLPDASGDLNLSLGSHAAGAVGRDLLGWWIVPLGLALGFAVAAATWQWNVRVVRRWRSGPQERLPRASA